jgi:hypothetical protein
MARTKKNPRRKQFVIKLLRQMRAPRRRRKTAKQSIRKSQQCLSNTQKDQQCRKRTAHTQKCWIHLAKQNNLRIKPSNIPNAGKGLFAWKKPIPRDTLFVINEDDALMHRTQRIRRHVL